MCISSVENRSMCLQALQPYTTVSQEPFYKALWHITANLIFPVWEEDCSVFIGTTHLNNRAPFPSLNARTLRTPKRWPFKECTGANSGDLAIWQYGKV